MTMADNSNGVPALPLFSAKDGYQLAFYMSRLSRDPEYHKERSLLRSLVEEHGGLWAQTCGDGEVHTLVRPEDKEAILQSLKPGKMYYLTTYVKDCVDQQTRLDLGPYEVKTPEPKQKRGHATFTPEDDEALVAYVSRADTRYSPKGDKFWQTAVDKLGYRQRHTWQSLKERWKKHLAARGEGSLGQKVSSPASDGSPETSRKEHKARHLPSFLQRAAKRHRVEVTEDASTEGSGPSRSHLGSESDSEPADGPGGAGNGVGPSSPGRSQGNAQAETRAHEPMRNAIVMAHVPVSPTGGSFSAPSSDGHPRERSPSTPRFSPVLKFNIELQGEVEIPGTAAGEDGELAAGAVGSWQQGGWITATGAAQTPNTPSRARATVRMRLEARDTERAAREGGQEEGLQQAEAQVELPAVGVSLPASPSFVPRGVGSLEPPLGRHLAVARGVSHKETGDGVEQGLQAGSPKEVGVRVRVSETQRWEEEAEPMEVEPTLGDWNLGLGFLQEPATQAPDESEPQRIANCLEASREANSAAARPTYEDSRPAPSHGHAPTVGSRRMVTHEPLAERDKASSMAGKAPGLNQASATWPRDQVTAGTSKAGKRHAAVAESLEGRGQRVGARGDPERGPKGGGRGRDQGQWADGQVSEEGAESEEGGGASAPASALRVEEEERLEQLSRGLTALQAMTNAPRTRVLEILRMTGGDFFAAKEVLESSRDDDDQRAAAKWTKHDDDVLLRFQKGGRVAFGHVASEMKRLRSTFGEEATEARLAFLTKPVRFGPSAEIVLSTEAACKDG